MSFTHSDTRSFTNSALGVAVYFSVQGVGEVHHGGRNHGLLHGLGRVGLGELEIVIGEGLVSERAFHETRKLTVMAVVEYGEVLPICFHVVDKSCTAQSAGQLSHVTKGKEKGKLLRDGIGCKAAGSLLPISDQFLAGGFHVLDTVLSSLVLSFHELSEGYFARIVVSECLLEVYQRTLGCKTTRYDSK